MAWNTPLAFERVLDVVDLAAPSLGDAILDVGCGTGELLLALADRGARGWGIDRDADAIDAARAQVRGRPVEFVHGMVAEASLPTGNALALCLGATHAFADGSEALPTAARTLLAHVRPGGHALIGEGFRRSPLPEPYRAFLGEPTGIERTHLDNVTACEAEGWSCIHAITASEAEWDAFEWAFFRRLGRVAWRDAWLRWGRDTMGFGLYLLRAPTGPA